VVRVHEVAGSNPVSPTTNLRSVPGTSATFYTEDMGNTLVPNRWVSLESSDLTAEVNPLGAQLSTLRDRAGRDLLWDGDPSVWIGRAPLLFPIVGALAGGSYRLGSTTHPLPRHGFARGKLFDRVDSTSATAVFRLKADEASFQVYPFRFELDVHFALDGPTLSVTACVRNAGDEDMPASFGFHPAFRWPLPFGQTRSSHFIEFASDEPAPVRRLNADGLLTSERHPTPISHRRLALVDTLFQDDVVIFDELRSRSVIYGADDGPRIQVSYPDAPYLGIWTKPQANFICIEPWHGVADPEGFSGDFRAKPGVVLVAAGAALEIKMAITLLDS
jgi:galactose mutarotase-like enzyme